MGKRIIVLILAVIFFLPAISSAVTQTFSWFPNHESDLAGYAMHIRHIFEEYDTSSDDWNGRGETFNDDGQEKVRCTIDGFGNGIFYLVIIAYDTSGNRSDFSNEVRIEIKNDTFVYGEVNYSREDNGIRFTLPDAAEIGVAGYRIYYTADGVTEMVDIGTDTEYFFELSDGLYTFDVVPYNEYGDEYQAYSPECNYFWPPMEMPDVKVEYVGIGVSKVLVGIAPSSDERIESYDYYLSSTRAKAISGEADIGEGISYTRNITADVSSIDYDMVFITIVPFNETNQIFGDYKIAYVLFGNIMGTYNEGIAWDQADVYGGDYNVFGYYYYNPAVISRPALNNYQNEDLYSYLPFTLQERCDYNNNGVTRFDTQDYSFLGGKYFNKGIDYAE